MFPIFYQHKAYCITNTLLPNIKKLQLTQTVQTEFTILDNTACKYSVMALPDVSVQIRFCWFCIVNAADQTIHPCPRL